MGLHAYWACLFIFVAYTNCIEYSVFTVERPILGVRVAMILNSDMLCGYSKWRIQPIVGMEFGDEGCESTRTSYNIGLSLWWSRVTGMARSTDVRVALLITSLNAVHNRKKWPYVQRRLIRNSRRQLPTAKLTGITVVRKKTFVVCRGTFFWKSKGIKHMVR